MNERRDELIAKSLDYFLEHGVAELSLRPLAQKIGTSARMVVYHFGSKAGLITALMDEVRAGIQKSFAAALMDSRTKPSGNVIHKFWAWMIQPSNVRYLRLLLEVQVLAMQNPARYARYLERTSSSWLEIIEASLPSSRENRIVATLYAAVIDGLLLEYLSTGDDQRTTKALDCFRGLMKARARRTRKLS
jgi:AcrR family transcriptional regulator